MTRYGGVEEREVPKEFEYKVSFTEKRGGVRGKDILYGREEARSRRN